MMASLRLHVTWTIAALRRFYYLVFHGISINIDGTMLPNLGKGKYVSVYRKGNYVDIVNEADSDFIRMIPYQPNHGYMIEHWHNNRLTSRTHLDYKTLVRISEGFVEGI
jgi:hypothetical protein